jgi:translation initiation factor RLI1
MVAIALDERQVAAVDEFICIGCGVCTPTCDAEAVGLVLRSEVKPPPDFNEFLAVRYKGA